MDIRKFFTSPKVNNTKNESSAKDKFPKADEAKAKSTEKKLKSPQQSKSKDDQPGKSELKRARHVISSSEDEESEEQVSRAKKVKVNDQTASEIKSKKVACTADDFFGESPKPKKPLSDKNKLRSPEEKKKKVTPAEKLLSNIQEKQSKSEEKSKGESSRRRDVSESPKKIKQEPQSSTSVKTPPTTKKVKSTSKAGMDFTPSTPKDDKTVLVAETPESQLKKKTGNGANYMAYLHREPPRHLGERTMSEGSPGCCKRFTVVMTGVMDYIEKDELKRIIEHCGGKVTGSVSGKTTHVISGRDAGPAKIEKAQKSGAKILTELEFFDFMEEITDKKTAFPAKVTDEDLEMSLIAEEMESMETDQVVKKEKKSPERKTKSPEKRAIDDATSSEAKSKKSPSKVKTEEANVSPKKKVIPQESRPASSSASDDHQPSTSKVVSASPPELMWVDKHKPTSTKQIIGQQGDKSNVAKLRQWLNNWKKNNAPGAPKKPTFGKFAQQDGSGFKAALLSGPPGVGKTTSAYLICKELNLECIEMNASVTRSKRSLKEEVSTLLSNKTLTESKSASGHVLIMDEVDGMAGNEDRGGIQELIALIKTTKIPVICICNDRSHPKMRTLVNYCFDLRYYKPQLKQIQAAMMSIAFREGVKVPPKLLEEMIVASNQDIRQVIHNLNLFCVMKKISTEPGKSSQMTKDVKLGPFDVVKRFLIADEGLSNSDYNQKQSLFFHDYNAIPLFIQENYVRVRPKGCSNNREHLQKLADASEAICIGDMFEKQIRSSNSWGLLPAQAMFSAVIPSDIIRGSMTSMINFPKWFGNYSSTGKHFRQTQSLHMHMSTHVSCDTVQMATEYLPLLKDKLTKPLTLREEGGIDEVIETMKGYDLQRSDIDAIIELTLWSGMKDPMADVKSKVKAALTRKINKEEMLLPYATDDMVIAHGKKTKGTKRTVKKEEEEEEFIEEDEAVDLAAFA